MKVYFQGGLGGQMMLYAFGRSVSLAKNFPLYFDKSRVDGDPQRSYALGAYDLDIRFDGPDGPVYHEHGPTFETAVYDVIAPNTVFDGYFFSWKYFNDVVVRKELARPKGEPSESTTRTAQAITDAKHSAFVSVRRGDHLWPGTKEFHGCIGLDYYLKGMQRIEEQYPETQFFVFSDDREWCRQNFHGDNCTVVDHSKLDSNNNPGTVCWDLWLMSLCQNSVLSNSSFSWWGAWLNPRVDRLVISPTRWYSATVDDSDIAPPGWLRVEAGLCDTVS